MFKKGKFYKQFIGLAMTALVVSAPMHAQARTFPLPSAGSNVVGEVFVMKTNGYVSLPSIARKYDIGQDEIFSANPRLAKYGHRNLPKGSKVVVPSLFILPDERQGIVINLAERRLYYFPSDKRVVETYPVGIGKEGDATPLMSTKIIEKTKNPEWRPPASARADAASYGVVLPKVVKPGPENPLGKYAMRLGRPNYLIHSTNRPWGVGKRVSGGCIRMYPENISEFFPKVEVGTPVVITHKAYRAGWKGNDLYFESNKPLKEHRRADNSTMYGAIQAALNKPGYDVDWAYARRVARTTNGVPYVVGNRYSHVASN